MNQIITEYEQFLENYDFGINVSSQQILDKKQKSKNGLFFDMKTTPDMLCFIAGSILKITNQKGSKSFRIKEFFSDDIAELVANFFDKPSPMDPTAAREYDKFFSQPTKLLAYAGVLSAIETSERGHPYEYTIINEKLLIYISRLTTNAIEFEKVYLSHILTIIGVMPFLEKFLAEPTKKTEKALRSCFDDFYKNYTAKERDLEPERIYKRIINLIAYNDTGTGIGINQKCVSIMDITYNRKNSRDSKKEKRVSRKVAASSLIEQENDYSIFQAKKLVAELHPTSEIHRLPNYSPIAVHHIFMKSEFPEFAALPENLISLSTHQHLDYAHDTTKKINKSYQIVCLLAKIDSIELSMFNNTCCFYSWERFIAILNKGFNTTIFNVNMNFETVKYQLMKFSFER